MSEKEQPEQDKPVFVKKSVDPTVLIPDPKTSTNSGSKGSEQPAPEKPSKGSDEKEK